MTTHTHWRKPTKQDVAYTVAKAIAKLEPLGIYYKGHADKGDEGPMPIKEVKSLDDGSVLLTLANGQTVTIPPCIIGPTDR